MRGYRTATLRSLGRVVDLTAAKARYTTGLKLSKQIAALGRQLRALHGLEALRGARRSSTSGQPREPRGPFPFMLYIRTKWFSDGRSARSVGAMGVAALVIAVGFVWLLLRTLGSSKKTPGQARSTIASVREKQDAPGLTFRMEMVQPDPAEWAREREVKQRARDAAIQRRKATFVPPESFDQGVAGIVVATGQFAQALGRPPPDIPSLPGGRSLPRVNRGKSK